MDRRAWHVARITGPHVRILIWSPDLYNVAETLSGLSTRGWSSMRKFAPVDSSSDSEDEAVAWEDGYDSLELPGALKHRQAILMQFCRWVKSTSIKALYSYAALQDGILWAIIGTTSMQVKKRRRRRRFTSNATQSYMYKLHLNATSGDPFRS